MSDKGIKYSKFSIIKCFQCASNVMVRKRKMITHKCDNAFANDLSDKYLVIKYFTQIYATKI